MNSTNSFSAPYITLGEANMRMFCSTQILSTFSLSSIIFVFYEREISSQSAAKHNDSCEEVVHCALVIVPHPPLIFCRHIRIFWEGFRGLQCVLNLLDSEKTRTFTSIADWYDSFGHCKVNCCGRKSAVLHTGLELRIHTQPPNSFIHSSMESFSK